MTNTEQEIAQACSDDGRTGFGRSPGPADDPDHAREAGRVEAASAVAAVRS
ncbi:MAG TPA: hypothetical protein VFT09_00365 [Ilumatobacteraceae bacterium]|nr:hypothetical protein [Ilumatobacteraceae bacterium]